jgi:hypothetical protein
MEKTDLKSALAEKAIPVLQAAISSLRFPLKQVLLSSILETCSVSGEEGKAQFDFTELTQILLFKVAWSDDRLKSNFHRVRAKDDGISPSRYSIAYFNQARRDFVLQGPLKK